MPTKSKSNASDKQEKLPRKLKNTHVFFERKPGALSLSRMLLDDEEYSPTVRGVKEKDGEITFTTVERAVSVKEVGNYLFENFTEIGRGQLMGEISVAGIPNADMRRFFKNHPKYKDLFQKKLDEIQRAKEEYNQQQKNNP